VLLDVDLRAPCHPSKEFKAPTEAVVLRTRAEKLRMS